MPRSLTVFVVSLCVAIPVGDAGAWAFNPDSGAVIHSEALWRIFGIMAEGGMFLVALLLVLCLVGGTIALVWTAKRKLIP